MSLDQQITEAFNKISQGKSKFMVLRIDNAEIDTSPVVLDYSSGKDETHQDMLTHLPSTDPRIVVYNIHYTLQTGVAKSKLVIMSWMPDALSGKRGLTIKMVYLNGFNKTKAELEIAHIVQACSIDEAALTPILEKATRYERDPIVSDSVY
eukprot:TRINITY_DN8847_c0_g1_i1.p1 TRINITY_DN8847_c0_g1~~TRINITY_DN8847_c0_g1_i1.p1  ORF type:complete len:151 (+),score=29.73 TRINITY_DN8847_c0_g1_i1:52-504(+)